MDILPHRKLHRLKNYDYGQAGVYFVTLCTQGKKKLLSRIVGNDALVVPTLVGEFVLDAWKNIAATNENVQVDAFVLMPNHVHGLIWLENEDDFLQTEKRFGFEASERRGRRSLQGLIRDFKSVTTRKYKRLTGLDYSLWQPSFYDEVIRDDAHYAAVARYMDQNPARWAEDPYHCPELGGISYYDTIIRDPGGLSGPRPGGPV